VQYVLVTYFFRDIMRLGRGEHVNGIWSCGIADVQGGGG